MGVERMLFFVLIFFILIHIVACTWLITAHLQNDEGVKGTWLEDFPEENKNKMALYNIAFYWTVTTITTVGYGDISGTNNIERAYCTIVMILGVLAFSFANGSLTSILASYDSSNAALKEKNDIFNRLNK